MRCFYTKIEGVISLKKGLFLAGLVLFSSISFAGVSFNFKDKAGDDKLTYPKNAVFVKKAFDLLELNIGEDGEDYLFTVKISADFKNEWKNVNGWDIQMFDVYMNFGTGKHKQTIAGRNAKLTQGWDKVLVIGPEDNKKMWEREIVSKNKDVFDDETDGENLVSDIMLPYTYQLDGKQLTVRVKKTDLPELQNLKSVQVFLMGAEGYPSQQYSYIRNVNAQNSEWRFGGGSDFDGDPNIVDILGENDKLKNYKSSEEASVYPWLDMIPVNSIKKTK